MAANKEKGAKHLTSLTLDISGIKQSLEEAQQMIEKKSVELGKTAAAGIQRGVSSEKISSETLGFGKVAEEAKKVETPYKNLTHLISREAKTVNGKLVQTVRTYEDSLKNVHKIQLNIHKDENIETETIKENYAKREAAEKKASQAKINELAKQRTYEEQISKEFAAGAQKHFNQEAGFDEKRKRSKQELFEMTDRLTKAAVKREALEKRLYGESSEKFNDLILKQKEFTNLVGQQKSTAVNRSIIKESQELTASLERAKELLVSFGSATPQTQHEIDRLAKAQRELGLRFKESGTMGESFFKQITDKAKWLSAFYIVDGLKRAFIGIKNTLQETEDSVVQLQRVLKEDIGQSAIGKELYDIAYNYGRAFADVQEVAVKFAQTGATWSDTVKLTESAMLALNTAELDVQESTEGLIAIMSQWDVPAEKMQGVIDKINITADKFPVTSEKMIAALQRSSSSARQAKMSFEETLGAITALSKATGRSGEAIGTALNSLVIYTSKTKALDKFYEVGNESVKKTVDAYKTGAATILDVWKALSKNLEQLTSDQERLQLLSGVDTDELGMHLEQEAAAVTDQIKTIYGSAGTFRQNYLVALLNDVSTIEKVTDNMTNAIGYSTAENEKYMATYSAGVQQLTSLWKGLVVEMNDGSLGFMGLLKGLNAAGIGVGKFVKATGGLNASLTLLLGILVKLKATKITNKFIKPLTESFGLFKLSVITFSEEFKKARANGAGFFDAIAKGRVAVSGADTATKGFVATLSTLQVALGAILMTIGLITGAIQKYQDVKSEKRQKNIEASEGILKEAESTKKLYDRFVELDSISDKTQEEQSEFNRLTYNLATAMRLSTVDAKGLALSFDELAESIRSSKDAAYGMTEPEWDKYLSDLEEELEVAGRKLGFLKSEAEISADQLSLLGEESRGIIEGLLGKFKTSTGPYHLFDSFLPQKGQEKEFYEAAYAAKEFFDELERGLTPAEKKIYSEIVDALGILEEKYTKLRVASIQHWVSENQGAVESVKTLEQFDEVIKQMMDDLEIDEGATGLIKELSEEFFPNLGESIGSVAEYASIGQEEVDALNESLSDLGKNLDKSQSGVDTAYNALEQYESQGYLTVDMIQSLLGAGYQYINMLDFTKGGIKLNEDATEELINAQRDNLLEMVKQAAASDILKLAQQRLAEASGETTNASAQLDSKLGVLGSKLASVTGEALAAGQSVTEFGNALRSAFDGESVPQGFNTEAFIKDAYEIKGAYQNIFDAIQNGFTGVGQYSSAAAKRAETDTKARYDAEKKELDGVKKAINERFNAEKERLEAQKDAVKDRYDAEIEALKDVQKENSRLDKQEDYLRNKRKAEQDVEKARTRSGVQYREQEAEANEKLNDIKTDWEKVLRDWAIEDKIKALEKLRDAEIANIELQIKAAEKQKDAAIKGVEQQIQALEVQKSVATSTYSGMSKSYKDDYLKPKAKAEKEYNDLSYESALKEHQLQMNKMKSASELNASAVYNAYRNNFILPFSRDLGGISNQISTMGMTLPFSPFGFTSAPIIGRLPESTNYNYNTTKNSTTFANFYGEGAARGASRSIYNMP